VQIGIFNMSEKKFALKFLAIAEKKYRALKTHSLTALEFFV